MSRIFTFQSTVKLRSITLLLVGIAAMSLSGCGKYAPPLPPESFAPARVRETSVVGSVSGVQFAWESPRVDQRGDELKTIEGYLIERKHLTRESDLLDSDVEYDQIATLEDQYLVELNNRRDIARAEGKPTRRVEPNSSLMKFTYLDSTVSPGERYVYRIVPFNQGGEKGQSGILHIVTFQGERSEIQSLETNEAEELTFE